GMLHLLGYDHEQEEQRLRMRQKEERVMEALGLQRDV
ncbi:MAG: rRNA maturation RNAse YbeY, partial [Clostridia bacterium]